MWVKAAMSKAPIQAKKDLGLIKNRALDIVQSSERRITQPELVMLLLKDLPVTKQEAKATIQDLISEGTLCYTNLFGSTFLEKSFNKPVRISSSVVLKPNGIFYQPEPKDIVIELQHGISFGTGQHPTTRLSIQGIEYAIQKLGILNKKVNPRALDIGTGSGVLAITSAKMGINHVIAIEIDPCSIKEARDNVKLNGLEGKVEINSQKLEKIEGNFHLITANLRYPTLKRIYSCILNLITPGGGVIFSGIKPDEVDEILKIYTSDRAFTCKWKKFEKSWAGLLFVKST